MEENKLYKVRFHATSTRSASTNAHVRFRSRSVKFGWNTMLIVGGALGAGAENNTIAQQYLPGVGSLNPDKLGNENGGWYTLLIHSPLNRDIRSDRGGHSAPLSETMPTLASQPGTGVNASSRRDLMLGLDLIDTFSGGPQGFPEQGDVTLDRIEVQQFDLVPD